MIGDEVAVMVLGVKGGQIRIGINAPKSVIIHREELHERIRTQQRPTVVQAEPPASAA